MFQHLTFKPHNPTPSRRYLMISEKTQIVGLFLIKFQIREGSTIIWKKLEPEIDIDLDNASLEFKAMPSGLHRKRNDNIIFTVPKRDGSKPFKGVAVYQQSGGRVGVSGVDRNSLAMYSLAVLIDPATSSNAYKHWIYINRLQKLLSDYIDLEEAQRDGGIVNDTTLFEGLNQYFDSRAQVASLNMSTNHPLLDTVNFIKHYGPNMFCLWRQCLLRKRVILVNTGACCHDFSTLSNFVHILSLLSTIPGDLKEMIPSQCSANIPVNPLYNVTLSDIPMLEQTDSYIACTSDDVLLDNCHLWDIAAISTPDGKCTLYESMASTLSGYSTVKRFTHKDGARYEFFIKALKINDAATANEFEPGNKWLNKLRTIYNEDTIYGAIWWAAAGSPAGLEIENDPQALRLIESWNVTQSRHDEWGIDLEDDDLEEGQQSPFTALSFHQNVNVPVGVVGYFHHLTRRLFSAVNGLIRIQNQAEMLSNSADYALSNLLSESVTSPILIDPIDMTHMGLDPFCIQDRQYLPEFIGLWWSRRATITSLGLTFCSC